MKTTKKLLTVLLTVVMLLSFALAGCGGNKAATDEATKAATSAEQSTQAQSAPADLPEVKLKWYVLSFAAQPDQDLVMGEVNKVLKENIKAVVDIEPVVIGDYDQKMKVIIASSEDYDLCFTAPWINNYVQNVSKGAFFPLDDLLPQYAPKRWEDLKQYWDAARVNGKIYGFINEQIFARTAAVTTEKALADKYNFDGTFTPGDLSSLEPYIAAVYKDSPDKLTSIGFTDIPETFNMEYINGWSTPGAVLLDDSNMKVFNYFESDNFLNYVNLMRDWNKKGYLHSEEVLAQKRDDISNIKNHKVTLMVGGAYKPGVETDLSLQYGMPYVAKPAGIPVLTTSGVIATMHAINRNSKNPERALMMLELINTDVKLYNLLNFGIEGTHFTMESGEMNREGEGAKEYSPNLAWMYGNQFLAHITKGQSTDVWEQTRNLNETARKSVLLGFAFSPDPVKNEIAKCSAVIGEYSQSISLGLLDDTKYKEFLDKLKKAGSDAIIAEMQKQIDAWKTTR